MYYKPRAGSAVRGRGRGTGAVHIGLRSVGVLAALVFIGASGAMNYTFMVAQGHSPLEGQILGAVSVAIDAMKALLPFVIAATFLSRQWLRMSLASLAWALFFIFSLMSAVGFAAMNRGAVSGDKDAINARHGLAVKELREVDGRLGTLPAARVSGIIEQELAAARQAPRWQSSRQCAEATAGESRKFCADFFRLQGELETALESQRLAEQQRRLRAEVKALLERGAGQDADPQVSVITRLLQKVLPAADFSDVRLSLIIFIAVLVEIGAAFGLYLFAGPRRRDARAPSAAVAKEPVKTPSPDSAAAEKAKARPVRLREVKPEPAALAPPREAVPVEAADSGPRRFGSEHVGRLADAVKG